MVSLKNVEEAEVLRSWRSLSKRYTYPAYQETPVS